MRDQEPDFLDLYSGSDTGDITLYKKINLPLTPFSEVIKKIFNLGIGVRVKNINWWLLSSCYYKFFF